MGAVGIFVKLAVVVFVAAVLCGVAVMLRHGMEKHTPPVEGKVRRRLLSVFVVSIAATLVGGAVSGVSGSDAVYFCFLVCPTLFAVFYSVIILAGKAHRKAAIGVIAGVVAFGAGLMLIPMTVSSTSDLDASVTGGKLCINGNYGEDIMLADIKDVRLTEALPQIAIRTNGYSFGGVNLGRFRTEEGSTVWLHSYSEQGPFIRITTNDGRTHYVNSKEPSQTKSLFHHIKESFGK